MHKFTIFLSLLVSGLLGFLLSWHVHRGTHSEMKEMTKQSMTSAPSSSTEIKESTKQLMPTAHVPTEVKGSTNQLKQAGDSPTEFKEPVRHMQTVHSPMTFVKQIQGDPDAGRKIFNEFCATCHNDPPIIDIHAPRIRDKEVWNAYNQLGVSRLLELTIEGKGAMPARGGCFECSDEQLKAAIQYILVQSIK